jgi:hypothetical protein
VFDQVFKSEGRLDFVFANVGIAERWELYAKHDQTPPERDQLTVDINLKAVISTTYFEQHYFRLSPWNKNGNQNLVMTASIGGLYKATVL